MSIFNNFISYAEVIPPEVFVPDEYQQMILDRLGNIIAVTTLISVLLILQLLYPFIKPAGRQDDEIF